MNRSQALPYVSYVVDDALNGRTLGNDQHAVIREVGGEFRYPSVLIGWQCGFEPLFVVVHSYLDVRLDEDYCVELATDYLSEIGWFSGEPTEPDYIIH